MKPTELFVFAIIIGVAIFGTLIREIRAVEKKGFNAVSFFVGAAVAAFMGIVIYFLAQSFHVDSNLAYVAAAICGYIGYPLLDIVAKAFKSRVEEQVKSTGKKK